MNQQQSEATLGLLMLGIFVDEKLTLKEGDALNTAAKSLEWHACRSKDIFALATFTHARKASKSSETTDAFIQEKVTAFTDAASQELLLRTLKTVLESDGLVECEVSFLNTIQAAFSRLI